MKTIPIPKARRGESSLVRIQRLMLDAVRRPLTGDEEMQPLWIDGRDTGEIAGSFIKPNNRLTSFQRLEIYNQQYWWRLLATLQEDYRGLRAVIGDAKFDPLLVAYLNIHPSKCWTLRNLGSHMPDFVAAHPEMVAPKVDLALDVARLEWARVVAYDDPAWPLLDFGALATFDGGTRIYLQPYLQLLEVSHPVDKFMVRLKKREEQSAANSAAHRSTTRARRLNAARSRKPIFLAVHRLEGSLYYKRLDSEAFRLLRALRDGHNLEDACEDAFVKSRLRATAQKRMVREWFSIWTQLNWLCAKP